MSELNDCNCRFSLSEDVQEMDMNTDQATRIVNEAPVEVEHRPVALTGRAPEHRYKSLYLIVSSKRNLLKKYGQPDFDQLDSDLGALKRAVKSRTNMDALVVYVDDAASLRRYGVEPVDPTRPEQVKMLIDNLDNRLNTVNRRIDYLLIVGGDTIVPFHRLPNPLDDQDGIVLSDNPYGARGDANHLIPDRAVGRMPDGGQSGVEFLCALVRNAATAHQNAVDSKGVLSSLVNALRSSRQPEQNGHSFGYSASIWRKASRTVFETVGHGRHLRISPPLTYQEFSLAGPLHFSYYNLHGVEDGPNWYGQRDSLFPARYPLFPVALRPEDLLETDHTNTVVFTEACYGANIQGKTPQDSIALRFLASNALAVVGSTKVAYGAVDAPLTGADLVARAFLDGLQSCLTMGESLKYAKAYLARQMEMRQGYLDGEDQKTLISFVLYGDPSLPASTRRCRLRAESLSKDLCPPLVCQKTSGRSKSPVSDKLIAAVKSQVEHSLPHMAHARTRIDPLTVCRGECGHPCKGAHKAAKALPSSGHNWALTLEKDIPVNGGAHHQVVKVTVDEAGHILKMAMSK
jgi:hypothetical protein